MTSRARGRFSFFGVAPPEHQSARPPVLALGYRAATRDDGIFSRYGVTRPTSVSSLPWSMGSQLAKCSCPRQSQFHWIQHPSTQGKVDAGSQKTLLSKLHDAKAALARGNATAARNRLRDAIDYAKAQSDKGMAPAAASLLVADMQYVLGTFW